MNISLLGSTGSIGTQTLDVARLHGFTVTSLACGANVGLAERQIREFKPKLAAVFDERAAADLRLRVADTNTKIVAGEDGVIEAASDPSADIVLNSVVGIAGLKPTLAAIDAKKNIALANKETLVAGGSIVMKRAREKGVAVIPVDSEHSAIFQCLQGSRRGEIKKVILTASGGPFYGKTRDELTNVTAEMALKHPNWSMGPKVTVDSSTLMNKGLEFIEAMWLFDLLPKQIQIVIHRQSIIHSMVEFNDNAIIAQLGAPDMRIPIQYALTYPQRLVSPVKELNITDYQTLTFAEPDTDTFCCLKIMTEAAREGGLKPCAANSANEEAVKLFLSGKIKYLDIPEIIEKAVADQSALTDVTVESITECDRAAREFVLNSYGA